MKKFVVIASLLLSSSSFAAIDPTFYCSTPGLSDAGHVLTLKGAGKSLNVVSAKLSQLSFTGTENLADLTCEGTFFAGVGEIADEKVATAYCHNPQLNDGGYSVRLLSGGLLGGLEAEIYSVSLLGSDLIDTLRCIAD